MDRDTQTTMSSLLSRGSRFLISSKWPAPRPDCEVFASSDGWLRRATEWMSRGRVTTFRQGAGLEACVQNGIGRPDLLTNASAPRILTER